MTKSDPSVRVYDVGSGRLLASGRDQSVAAHGASATALSPDGSTLAVATGDRVDPVRRENPPNGEEPALTGHTAPVLEVAYSHNGRLLATSSEDGTARGLGRPHRRPAAPVRRGRAQCVWPSPTTTAGCSPPEAPGSSRPGASPVPAGSSPWARTPVLPTRGTPQSIPAPDGHTVARVRSGRLWFEDTRTGETTTGPARLGGREPDLVWSSDSRWLLSVVGPFRGPDRVVTVWNASNGSVAARRGRFVAPDGDVRATFSRDAKHVFVHDSMSLHTLDRTTLRPAYPPTDAASGRERSRVPSRRIGVRPPPVRRVVPAGGPACARGRRQCCAGAARLRGRAMA